MKTSPLKASGFPAPATHGYFLFFLFLTILGKIRKISSIYAKITKFLFKITKFSKASKFYLKLKLFIDFLWKYFEAISKFRGSSHGPTRLPLILPSLVDHDSATNSVGPLQNLLLFLKPKLQDRT